MAKRIVLITLILSLFSCFTVFAKNDSDLNNSTYNGKNLVEYLEIINPDVDLDSDFVTRELFALYVARMLKIDELQTSNVRYFSDVEYDSFSVNAINALVEKGIIAVPENHLFRPGDYITETEALKMLVCVLGWEQPALLNGGYPVGFLNVASNLDIDVHCENINIITVAEAGEMIYNALRANVYGVNLSGSVTFSESDEIFLEKYWNISEAEGTVEAVYGASMVKNYKSEDNTIFIDGEEYIIESGFETEEYLGDYVRYFYIEEKNDKTPKIIFAERAGRLENINIEPDDFESVAEETIYYYNENNKLVKETLNDPVMIYNGSIIGENLSEIISNINKGNIVLKDSDNDEKYDVMIIEDYRGFVISSLGDEGKIIYDKVGLMDDLKFEDYEAVILKNSVGEKISYAELKVGQVLSVASSKDNTCIRVILELDKLSGTLMGIKKDVSEPKIVVDDETFMVDKTFLNYIEKVCITGQKYEFTVDSFDKIVYVTSTEEFLEYGYILKLYYDDIEETTVIKLLTQNGEVKRFKCSEKVKLDGRRCEGRNIYAIMDANSKDYRQIIRYSLKDETITKIDTKELGDESERTSMYDIFPGQERTERWYGGMRIGLKALINSNTVIFCMPLNSDGVQDDDFFILKSNELRTDAIYYCDAYKNGSINSYADALIIYYEPEGWGNNEAVNKKIFIVEEITQQLHNDEVVTAIHGYERGAEKTVYDDEGMDFGKVEKGDLLRFGYDRDGTLRRINNGLGYEFIYDCSTKAAPVPDSGQWINTATQIDATADPSTGCLVYNKGGSDTGYYRAEYQISYGEVLAVKDSVVEWNGTGGNIYTDSADLSGVPIMVIDEKSGKISSGSVENIVDKESSSKYSRIFFEQSGGSGKSAIIYNFK